MTLITFHDGKPVFRDGKVGTGQGCCCESGCGRCVVNGQVNHDYRTQAECERCRQCVEMLQTECNGDCPSGALPGESLVTLEFSSEECGTGGAGSVEIGCGTILSATITNGGSGYATETVSAPTLTATAPGGTGGVLSISGYTKLVGGTFDGYYVPTGITVVSGGSGYTDNAQVTLSLGTDDEWAPGSGESNIRIRTILRPPADQWTLTPGATAPTGTGLVISMTFPASPEFDSLSGLWIFRAQSVSVVNGGSGYAVGQTVGPRAVEGDPTSTVGRAVVRITQVDAAGSVLSVAFGTGVLARGRYRLDTGVISSVVITSNRPARKRAIEVCEVAVSVVQEAPSNGTGATITATVETAAGANFGTVTGLTVTNGGSGYVSLCEKKTTVASCDECPPRESPESATCEETGGCPCGTWVVDHNQEPCECCQWTLIPSPFAVGFTPSESNSQELNDCICNAFNQAFEDMGAAFEEAGWTVTLGPPPDGQQCGGSITAVCEECERAIPDRFYVPFVSVTQSPCNLDHWVEMSRFDFGSACGTTAFIGFPGFACVRGGQIVAGESVAIYEYSFNNQFYVPRCGQRITECSCCQRLAALPGTGSLVLDPNTVLEEFDAACCGDCPQGMFWVCRSGRCNPLP